MATADKPDRVPPGLLSTRNCVIAFAVVEALVIALGLYAFLAR